DRCLSGGSGALQRTLSRRPCRGPVASGHLFSGRRRQDRAARPDGKDGGRVAPARCPGRLFAVLRRAARLPPGRQHSARARCGALFLFVPGVWNAPQFLTTEDGRRTTDKEIIISFICPLSSVVYHPIAATALTSIRNPS